MPEIRIKLTGDVAFQNDIKLSEGFLCDVPVDPLGIPYIPLPELLPEEVTGKLRVGYAFPEGYLGLVKEADRLTKLMPDIMPQIRSCFTGKRFYPEEGAWVRFLRSGQIFCASIYAHGDFEALEAVLASITRLGIEKEGISGRVECTLSTGKTNRSHRTFPGCDLQCDRLEYTLMPVTPMCLFAPYASGVKTATFIPGMVLRDTLEKNADATLAAKLRDMTFSNAYISDGTERLLPLPLCMALVKLDKRQLHYRLSSGKDPNRAEQDVSPGDAYARSFESSLTTFTRPEVERIVSREGVMYDALCQGQMFRGTIYGEDAALRELYAYLLAHPSLAFGHLTQEGFGQVYLKAGLLPSEKLKAEYLARSFDVSCLSHVLIMSRSGIPDTTAEGLLEEVERRLCAPGKLKIVGRYMDVHEDFSWNSRWGQEGPVVRCLAKGSVMRLETKDGLPVNIAPILHAFVGERTKDGYGEIMAFPALEGYYRAAETVAPEKYKMKLPLSFLWLHFSAKLTDQVIGRILKKRIQSLAVSDRGDVPAKEGADRPVPLDLLRFIRDRFDPTVSDELLALWYREGLEEDTDEFIFEE